MTRQSNQQNKQKPLTSYKKVEEENPPPEENLAINANNETKTC